MAAVHPCGLAVHADLAHRGFYTVTHVKTGRKVMWDLVFTKTGALKWLLKIQNALPWHEGEESMRQYDLRQVRLALLDAYNSVDERRLVKDEDSSLVPGIQP